VTNFRSIQIKLEQFVRKYYTNELIKGAILFFAIGLLCFLATLLIEYVMWLNPTARTVLFWLFVVVEFGFLLRFIVLPLAKLLKLQKGINYEDASTIIGSYFPEVNDKLLNVLQLHKDTSQSELLLASIDQKSIELKPIPFKFAINFKNNAKYLKYAIIPVIIILISLLTGHFNWFSDSYERVLNHQMAYQPPAPFHFYVMNEELKVIENKDFKIFINTVGEFVPEDVQIKYYNENYYLKQLQPGRFEYVIPNIKNDITFNLFASNITSNTYTIKVIKVPTLLNFDMVLDYPSYTKKKDETLKGIGNAIVPQGTKVTWQLKTQSTDNVKLYSKDTILFLSPKKDLFEASKRLNSSFDYSLNTSNTNLKDYESLAFSIDVIKDEYPKINLQMEQDSIDHQTLYFYGQISDDYGLNKLQLVYYPTTGDKKITKESIPVASSNFDEFLSTFPNQLNLKEGVSYELYFEVFDNDVLHNYKSTKSNVFSYRKLTQDEKEQNQLKEQNETIEDLNKSLEKFDEQDNELKELSKTQKEKSRLNFNDKKKFENFLKRQEQQEEMMQNFNKKLKDNLEKFQIENKEKDQFKKDLEQRLEENQKQLEKDEKLLEELKKLAKKIQKEELSAKLEQLAKQNKNKKRSLEQLLELTKRYYVSKKLEKLKDELKELAEEQEKLSEETKEENTKEKQDELNKQFKDFQKEMENLQNESQKLREPINVPNDKKKEEDIKKEQQEASDNLEKKEQSQNQEEQNQSEIKAKKNQKKAAQKMMQMSEQMEQSMMQGSGQELSEDIDMLRQILDNLLLFSFDQEDLMNTFKSIQVNHNEYAKYLKEQKGLREHFEHVDDSLFTLSLRQPMISELINKEITEVFFNLDKSLEQLAENRLYQGVSAQQYTVTSANMLASFLSDLLDNMENQLNPQPGQGKGDMQLPDIIKSQEELNKEMQEGMKKSEQGKQGKEGKKEGEEKGEEGEKNKRQQGTQKGDNEGNSEDLNGELFRIYQQQQQLRQALEDELGKEGKAGGVGDLLNTMENIEQDLLNKGFTKQTLQKMMALQHQLLKLENATFQQGEDEKRTAKTNKNNFINTTTNQLLNTKQYFNTTEILNRQALPLQQVYKKKVQDYFKKKND
jgi:hypothetical protein